MLFLIEIINQAGQGKSGVPSVHPNCKRDLLLPYINANLQKHRVEQKLGTLLVCYCVSLSKYEVAACVIDFKCGLDRRANQVRGLPIYEKKKTKWMLPMTISQRLFSFVFSFEGKYFPFLFSRSTKQRLTCHIYDVLHHKRARRKIGKQMTPTVGC